MRALQEPCQKELHSLEFTWVTACPSQRGLAHRPKGQDRTGRQQAYPHPMLGWRKALVWSPHSSLPDHRTRDAAVRPQAVDTAPKRDASPRRPSTKGWLARRATAAAQGGKPALPFALPAVAKAPAVHSQAERGAALKTSPSPFPPPASLAVLLGHVQVSSITLTSQQHGFASQFGNCT